MNTDMNKSKIQADYDMNENKKQQRKPVPKKVRFEVFKRDSFTCQYCGLSAPEVILHLDHILPVSKGGDNELMNLITSCKPCNLGKGATLLTDQTMIEKQKAQLDELNEKRQQLEMMIEWRESLRDFDDGAAKRLAEYFGEQVGYEINNRTIKEVAKWVKKYTYLDVLEAIDISVEQYIKNDTKEEVLHAFVMIPRICGVKKKQASTGEDFSHLYYIRGILRNRLSYCNDKAAIQLLRAANSAGVDEQDLKEMAIECDNWTQWQAMMNQAMEA